MWKVVAIGWPKFLLAYLSRNAGAWGVYANEKKKKGSLRCDEGVSVQPPSAAEETWLSSFLACSNLQKKKQQQRNQPSLNSLILVVVEVKAKENFKMSYWRMQKTNIIRTNKYTAYKSCFQTQKAI